MKLNKLFRDFLAQYDSPDKTAKHLKTSIAGPLQEILNKFFPYRNIELHILTGQGNKRLKQTEPPKAVFKDINNYFHVEYRFNNKSNRVSLVFTKDDISISENERNQLFQYTKDLGKYKQSYLNDFYCVHYDFNKIIGEKIITEDLGLFLKTYDRFIKNCGSGLIKGEEKNINSKEDNIRYGNDVFFILSPKDKDKTNVYWLTKKDVRHMTRLEALNYSSKNNYSRKNTTSHQVEFKEHIMALRPTTTPDNNDSADVEKRKPLTKRTSYKQTELHIAGFNQ